VSAATQNQAKSSLLFLYKHVLGIDLPWLNEVVQAKVARKLPVVLTAGEVRALLDQMDGTTGLVVRLPYGSGMRLLARYVTRHNAPETTLIFKAFRASSGLTLVAPQGFEPWTKRL